MTGIFTFYPDINFIYKKEGRKFAKKYHANLQKEPYKSVFTGKLQVKFDLVEANLNENCDEIWDEWLGYRSNGRISCTNEHAGHLEHLAL